MTAIKKLGITLFFAIISFAVFACGNEYYEMQKTVPYRKDGKLNLTALLNYKKDIVPYWYHGFFPDSEDAGGNDFPWAYQDKFRTLGLLTGDEYNIEWKHLEAALKKNVDYKLLSDYAWAAVKFGNKEDAVKLLEKLYKDHPGEYNIVANLGTAYEVTGNDAKALELLRKAVEINPLSHYGSEWIHIAILEEKLSAEKDYTKILGLPGDRSNPHWADGVKFPYGSADSLLVQLAYQLHERIGFVPKPDPVVGQLIKDFSDLVALTHTKKDAAEFYNYAISYDSSLTKNKTVTKPEEKTDSDAKQTGEKKSSNKPYFIVGGGFLFAGLFIYLLRQKRR